ncbi:hypothetical protein OS493_036749 [Desmophyllum pertusum]|uniref:Uncharacterized protein n=1 Tax=Desmophyllum pertusum TaxID=174260 RepID=A0A9W9Z6G7_9CNID|nr:hypothetical protein OS493_036749 [Desmophyllum pertusum]
MKRATLLAMGPQTAVPSVASSDRPSANSIREERNEAVQSSRRSIAVQEEENSPGTHLDCTKVTNLLTPTFSEDGSNQRRYEGIVYGAFFVGTYEKYKVEGEPE